MRQSHVVCALFEASAAGRRVASEGRPIGRPDQTRLRERVVNSLKTTFASHYTRTISLPEVLDLENIAIYNFGSAGFRNARPCSVSRLSELPSMRIDGVSWRS